MDAAGRSLPARSRFARRFQKTKAPLRRRTPVRRRAPVVLDRLGGSTFKWNTSPGVPDPTIRVIRTTHHAQTFAGPQVEAFSAAFFDPSGTVAVATVFGSAAVNCRLPGWATIQTLFDQYKVNSIKLRFRFAPNVGGVAAIAGVGIRFRYNYDASSNPGLPDVQSEPGWTEHWFTPERPVIEFTIYPKVSNDLESGSVLGVVIGGQIQTPQWLDTDAPPILLGAELAIINLPTLDNIYCDLVQDVSFRYISA